MHHFFIVNDFIGIEQHVAEDGGTDTVEGGLQVGRARDVAGRKDGGR